jgi:NAD(P)-dependent dehydrogenase (short-subunit alcohol dehydrogenase family)
MPSTQRPGARGEAGGNTMNVELPSFRLDDRIAVVTGASEGIGRVIALAFSAAGAELVLFSRRKEKLDELAAEIGEGRGSAWIVPGDVTRVDDLQSLARLVEERVTRDGRSIVLMNNAGFGYTKAALETPEEDWDRLFDVHVKGTFLVSRAMAPLMLARGYGKIINMSSTWSESTDLGKAGYSSAKAAVSQLTASLSTEWAPSGIRVNALAPTTTMTNFTAKAMADNPQRAQRLLSRIKLGRYAEPSDLVGPALFLASPASDFVTGQTLFVDGGWNAGG